ncbi:MAG: hypothetical protein HUU35_17560, partial [Armatimonadetes bacterium]|nr:hypothetical protein [Armatimonadota bacterium]
MSARTHRPAPEIRRSPSERCSLAVLAMLWLFGATSAGRAAELPLGVRGQAAVWLQPAGGSLTVRLTKQDLNIYPGPDRLVAQLFNAERRLLGAIEIEDDGSTAKGPAQGTQEGSLTVEVGAVGPCRLQVAAPTSNDLVWGLVSDAAGYAVEGQPLLNSPTVGGPVAFVPPTGAFAIRLSALHEPGVQTVELHDGNGRIVHTFNLARLGVEQVCSLPADPARSGLWRLEIGKWDVKLAIDGVTFWTAEPATWLDPEPYVHLLYPYHQTRYLEPGRPEELRYQLRNRGSGTLTYRLAATAPPGVALALSAPEVKVGPRRAAEVTVTVTSTVRLPNAVRGRLVATRADRSEVVTSAGIELRPGPSPVSQPLAL